MDLRFLITLSILGTIVSTTECLRKEQEWRRDKICGPTSPHLRGNPLLVETQSGKIQGVQSVSRGGKEFIKFLGIPFAQPPVGKLRFESPKPFGKWDGVLNATEYRRPCAYFDFFNKMQNGVEDCLYLNVLTPLNRSDDQLLPVLVYIHGLSFFFAGSLVYEGDYKMDHKIVIVTMDYRLGPLGFLNTNDGLIRGNMGLKDQNLALHWVQKNIRQFGGDPDLVTLSGTSVGAISVNHHLFSPRSKGLFSKAIMMSGSNLTPNGIMRSPKQTADNFIAKVNCTVGSRKDEVACLNNLNTSQILNGYRDMIVRQKSGYYTLKNN
ncbi:esterase SG1-like [Folsomia candida]|uniref:esterase SG1-like n=1 Tax=Folsomia candida TaxID=158441 RepID=UPI001604AEA9|nr:esterase SG1-like [Folsomia candida]